MDWRSKQSSFRLIGGDGKSSLTMMTSHCHNEVAKARRFVHSVLLDDTDLVAGDFSGASWRRNVGAGQQYGSTLEVATENTRLPVPPGTPLWWSPGSMPHDVCGFDKPCEFSTGGFQASMVRSRSTVTNWVFPTRTHQAIARRGFIWVTSRQYSSC